MTGLLVGGILLLLAVLVVGGVLLFVLPIVLAVVGIAVVLLAGVAVAALVLPNFVTLDDFKPQILEAVKKATGRDLTIGGPISFSVWPVLGLTLNEVSLSNPEGSADPVMLSVKEAAVGVTLAALRSGKLEVTEFRLVQPVIALTVDKKGQGNWVLGGQATKAEEQKKSEGGFTTLKDINISNVKIVDGALTFRPATGQAVEVKKVNFNLSLPSLDEPLNLDGTLDYKGRSLALSASVADPRALTEGGDSALIAKVSAGRDTLALNGQLLGKSKGFEGAADLKVANLADLMAFATGAAATALPITTITAKTQLKANEKSANFSDLSLMLDDLSVKGSGQASWQGKPALNAKLTVGQIDMAKFQTATAAATGGSGGEAAVAKAPDLKFLEAFDANIQANLAGLAADKVQLGATTATLVVQAGQLKANITPASLFGGTVAGSATATPRSFSVNTTLDGVAVEAALKAFSGADKLSGKGDVKLALTGPIATPAGIKAGLNGSGSVVLKDGAIKGVNIPAMVRKAKATLTGKAVAGGEAESTDFTELSGTFAIKNGLVTNNDLKMLSPLVRVGGTGTASLPEGRLNYRVNATLVADITGQGGKADASGLIVPIIISGPFTQLSYAPDLEGLVMGNINSVGQIIDGAKDLNLKDLKTGGKEAVRGQLDQLAPGLGDLLGKKKAAPAPAPSVAPEAAPVPADGPAPTPPPEKKADPAEQLLRGLLGQ